ncbi:MAG TPA: hypothetical protein VIT38_10285 [Allosphingosinicella sp.]
MKVKDPGLLQRRISAGRAELVGLRAGHRAALEAHRTLEARHAALAAQTGTVSRSDLAASLGAVRSAAAAVGIAQVSLDEAAKKFGDVRGEIHSIPPQETVKWCDDQFPFLLLPVRLECRFDGDPAKPALKVRMFPDRPGIDSLDELLTVEELKSAEIFWTEVWRAGGNRAGEIAAWRALAQAHGSNRAAWIAHRHAPTNERRGDGASNRPGQTLAAGQPLVPAPVFPAATGRLLSWSRAPQAIGLPERFVAIGYVQGQRVFEIAGAAIPEMLMTGPDPLSADDGSAAASAADLPAVDQGMKWMVDFDEAVRVGMAMRIDLPPAAHDGLDELVVLGVRTSAEAAEGAALAETMIRTHLYGPHGFGFVPQGTPTNDTGPAEPPGDAMAAMEAVYEREFRPGSPSASEDWQDKSDGRHFASALGIDPQIVRPAANSEAMDQADARAMNIALWPATLRPFLEEMLDSLLGRTTIRKVQQLFQAHVSGRGPVPAIRIGDQPYGVVVTSALSRWTPEPVRTGRAVAADPFRVGLSDLLGRLDTIWEQLAAGVPALGEGQDSQSVLLDVLGLQPRSAEIYQRFATSLDQLAWAQQLNGLGSVWQALPKIMKAKSQAVLAALGVDPAKLPEVYRRVFYDSSNRLAGPLVDAPPLSETAALKAISAGNENYVAWLSTQGIDTLRSEDFGAIGGKAVPPPRTLLYLLLRNAMLSAFWDSGWRFYESAGLAAQMTRADPIISNVQQGVRTQSKYRLLYGDSGPLAAIDPDMFRAGRTIAESFDVTKLTLRPETEDLWSVRRACGWLAGRPTAKLDRAFREHIDLCSNRFDAWRLALVNERLYELRSRPASKKGLYVGAFGYLHKLKPRPPARPYTGSLPAGLTPTAPGRAVSEQDGAEHILAPSLNHAVTAAVLRSAYLTHAGPDRPAAMSIDISSARVRSALDLLDGVRSGQGLAELLGYQFERGLHDSHAQAEVDKYIYPLRKRFPLASGRQVATPAGVAIQAVEARNVIDGLALVQQIQSSGKRNYPFGFTDLPTINPSKPAEVKEAAAIDAQAARLIDMLDGVADLMLSEGAYSAAMGNLERAGAALDALSGANTPPEPEIARTRRGGHGLTHRLCLLLPAAPSQPSESIGTGPGPRTGGGPVLSPRARMEPELNAWLKGLFGDLRAVMCRTRWTVRRRPRTQYDLPLSELGIEPIDLLYMAEPGSAAAAGELDRRIALAVRRLHHLGEEVKVAIDYAEPVKGSITLFEILPMIRAAKGLLLSRAPLGARHFAPPTRPPAPTNPNGWRAGDFESRLETALQALSVLMRTLKQAGPPLESAGRTAAHFDRMRSLLVAAAGYGIIGALPATSDGADPAMVPPLLDQGRRAEAAIAERIAAAAAARAGSGGFDEDGRVGVCIAAVKAIFGADFITLPDFQLEAPDEIEGSAADRSALLRHAGTADAFPLDTWLAGLARVRAAPAHLERIVTLAPALGHAEPDLVPLQLPRRAGDHWLGAVLPPDYAFGTDSLLATTILAGGGKLGTPRAGLLLDEWTEIIPSKEQTAAVTFRYDGPDSEPPQVLLLAVSPELNGAWAWDDLVDSVRETVRLARHRAVEPRHIDQSELGQLLPAIMIPFTATSDSISANIAGVLTLKTGG